MIRYYLHFSLNFAEGFHLLLISGLEFRLNVVGNGEGSSLSVHLNNWHHFLQKGLLDVHFLFIYLF